MKYKNSDDLIYRYEVEGEKKQIGFSKKSIAKGNEAAFIASHQHLLATVENPLGLTENQVKEVYGLAAETKPAEEVKTSTEGQEPLKEGKKKNQQ